MRIIPVYCKALAWMQSLVIAVFLVSAPVRAAYETYLAMVERLNEQAMAQKLVRPDLEIELLQLANSYRQSQGLPALKMDKANQAAARAHALDMMQGHFMGHVASSGQGFESRMRALRPGQMFLPRLGENAARVSRPGVVDAKMAAGLFQQWVKSAPHRHNLVSRDYVSVATGVVSQGNVLYADQIFAGPEVKTNVGSGTPDVGQGLY